MGDAGLEHLNGLGLLWLYLNRTQVTDAGPAASQDTPQLGVTWILEGTSVTDAGLEPLGALTGLYFLNLNETRVSDAGLEHLKGLTLLTELQLKGTRVTDEGVKKLQQSLPDCDDRGALRRAGDSHSATSSGAGVSDSG